MNGQQRVIIESIKPQIDCGAFPVKRVINDKVEVSADIFCDSHDVLSAEVLFRFQGEKEWHIAAMEHLVNDRWKGEFTVSKLGSYTYSVQAWVDHFRSWHRDILKRIDAQTDYSVDLLIGAEIIAEALQNNSKVSAKEKEFLKNVIQDFQAKDKAAEDKIDVILSQRLYQIMTQYPVKKHVTLYPKEFEVNVERVKANFSSWYEVFPRSLGLDEKHGTFNDVVNFLPYVANLGFDVLYLPPIHPIGETNRKGENNNVTAEQGEPGSPWAIGGKEGGHKAIHPELGTMDDFEKLVQEAAGKGIDIAMDVAFQCSPDHPYVKDHPEWFKQRPDGSLQYAENPPKKYEDIYPLNFETEDWKNLWEELKSVFLFWIEKGVKIFRVDNPHTKSMRFWGWAIQNIKKEHPDVIFLAEAFTRPKVMNNLAKQGFTQSYTYFTWRNTKYEITKYCKELVNSDARDFFRPNFWPNTPDILPEFLQVANRAGFIQRIALAATLSSNYGIYGPAYELMENTPTHPGKEEYLNSEKYEIKNWDLNKPNNLGKIIKRLNKIRHENEALQNTHSLKFHDIENEALVCYSKTTDDLSNIILVVVSLDPHHTHSGWVRFPLEEFEMDEHTPFQVHDLLSGAFYLWNGDHNYVEIDPGVMPVQIFKVRRKVRSEKDFDYFM
ncbi:alpha-1,4-glucan--maltose-1-phosphate maltosyltransferase [Sunxiuqinia indica]|uniref:alpha-1,4-glucan--maltose-1-phosphate maltosyltransferase n=1 Tax=Sunxiuqinia indica TaxID=2692584 RepID=UPI001356CAF3|nr:alpha-1,4-glucan--maltose-1-phosphate maltosyltransferase [Sunxiuqinia indica]